MCVSAPFNKAHYLLAPYLLYYNTINVNKCCNGDSLHWTIVPARYGLYRHYW